MDSGPENIGTDAPDPGVDSSVLQAIARAIRHLEWLRFDYDDEPRLVEPYRLLSWQRRWHLVARDPQHGTWVTSVGVVDAIDESHCVLVTGADSLDTVAVYIGMLMMDFTVESPAELVPRLHLISERYARAVAGSAVN